MNLHLYQIVVPLVSLSMVMYAFSLFRRGRKTIKEMIIWTIFWGIISFVAIYPEVTNVVAKVTGIQNNVNAVVFVSFVILFFVVFKLVVIIENIEQRITAIVRNDALKDIKRMTNDE